MQQLVFQVTNGGSAICAAYSSVNLAKCRLETVSERHYGRTGHSEGEYSLQCQDDEQLLIVKVVGPVYQGRVHEYYLQGLEKPVEGYWQKANIERGILDVPGRGEVPLPKEWHELSLP